MAISTSGAEGTLESTTETATTLPQSSQSIPRELPDEPLISIEAGQTWSALNLKDLWQYRELTYFLTWRDLKVRYKQTALGVTWVILQPLLSTLVFTIFLGKLARVPSDGYPYELFVFAGLLPWTFLSTAVLSSGNSLIGNAHLITKVYFPRMIIPGSAVIGRLVDFAISLVILFGMMFYYGVPLSRNLLMLPVLIILVALLALAIGTWTSALNVKYRDVGVAFPVLIQFWMFASPVVYPSSLVYSFGLSRGWMAVYTLNPVVGIVDNFRAALLGSPFNWPALGVSASFTICLLIYAAYSFKRMERNFADVV